MTSFAAVLLVGIVITVGGGLLLYAMVEREHDQRTVTDWERGERAARRDTDDRE